MLLLDVYYQIRRKGVRLILATIFCIFSVQVALGRVPANSNIGNWISWSQSGSRLECQKVVENGTYGNIVWPLTRGGHMAKVVCPFGPANKTRFSRNLGGGFIFTEEEAYAKRNCEWYRGVARWANPNHTACASKKVMTPEQAAQAAEELVIQTSDPSLINQESFFINATETIEQIYPHALGEKHVACSMLNAVSNLMSVGQQVLDTDVGMRQSRRMVLLVDQYTSSVDVKPNNTQEFTFKNLAMHVRVMENTDGLEYKPNGTSSDGTEDVNFGDIAVSIPKEAVTQVSSEESGLVRVRFVVLRNSRFLRPPGKYSSEQVIVSAALSRHLSDEVSTDTERELPPDTGQSVSGLINAVRITMPWSHPGTTHVCSYFDPHTDTWKTDGVSTRFLSSHVVCHSNHLTAFSMLLDPDPRQGLGDLGSILDVLSAVGSTFSVIGLVITIITYSCFRIGCDRWGRVLTQLCVSLLLLHIAFFLTSWKGTLPGEACAIVSAATHGLLISSLCWMLVEAFLLYELLITVFPSTENRFMMKRMLFAWGLPPLVVAVTVCCDLRYYTDTHPDYCLTSGQIWNLHLLVLMTPCCVILSANLFVFIQVARVLLKRRMPNNQSQSTAQPCKMRVSCAQIRGVVGVASLLGMAWTLGPLAVYGFRPYLQLASSFLNSIQGSAIFLSRVALHSEARKQWALILSKPFRQASSTSSSEFCSVDKGLWSRIRWRQSNSQSSIKKEEPAGPASKSDSSKVGEKRQTKSASVSSSQESSMAHKM